MLSCSHVEVEHENVWDAIVADDIGAIKKFLREGVDPNSKSRVRQPVTAYACNVAR